MSRVRSPSDAINCSSYMSFARFVGVMLHWVNFGLMRHNGEKQVLWPLYVKRNFTLQRKKHPVVSIIQHLESGSNQQTPRVSLMPGLECQWSGQRLGTPRCLHEGCFSQNCCSYLGTFVSSRRRRFILAHKGLVLPKHLF